jgi:hypothetical protein
MLTPTPGRLNLSALANVLFASPVQPSQYPSPEAIKAAIEEQLCSCHGDPAPCVLLVAQEAGDHPDLYLARMEWARRSIARAYCDPQPVNVRPLFNIRPQYGEGTLPGAPSFIRGAA